MSVTSFGRRVRHRGRRHRADLGGRRDRVPAASPGVRGTVVPQRRVRHGDPSASRARSRARRGGCDQSLCRLAGRAGSSGDRREIIVVADNCNDATAERARAAGATVWERVDEELPGKGQAIAWALTACSATIRRSTPSPWSTPTASPPRTSSSTFDVALRGGAAAVQVAYDVANPEASSSAALRWAGFALMHRVRPRGRRGLGLSADLFGSGMAFRTGSCAHIRGAASRSQRMPSTTSSS